MPTPAERQAEVTAEMVAEATAQGRVEGAAQAQAEIDGALSMLLALERIAGGSGRLSSTLLRLHKSDPRAALAELEAMPFRRMQ